MTDRAPTPPADTYAPQPNVTRLEVIDHTAKGEGRILVRYGVRVALSYQDGGRTLKVFLTEAEGKRK